MGPDLGQSYPNDSLGTSKSKYWSRDVHDSKHLNNYLKTLSLPCILTKVYIDVYDNCVAFS